MLELQRVFSSLPNIILAGSLCLDAGTCGLQEQLSQRRDRCFVRIKSLPVPRVVGKGFYVCNLESPIIACADRVASLNVFEIEVFFFFQFANFAFTYPILYMNIVLKFIWSRFLKWAYASGIISRNPISRAFHWSRSITGACVAPSACKAVRDSPSCSLCSHMDSH